MEIQTATEILDLYRPRTLAEYKAAFAKHSINKKKVDPKFREQPQATELHAGIDCGRWLANCPNPTCGSGVALHPKWPYAICFGCGWSWTKIVWPTEEQLKQILAILDARVGKRPPPRSYHSWWPEETLDDLRAENMRRGWTVPPPA